MKDKLLLKISLLTSVIGIFILFVFLQYEEVNVLNVTNFTDMINSNCDSDSDEYFDNINIIGVVENINENNKTLLIDLVEYKRINQKAIMFKDSSDVIGINDGDIVEVNGNWYNGKLILNNIERIKINS